MGQSQANCIWTLHGYGLATCATSRVQLAARYHSTMCELQWGICLHVRTQIQRSKQRHYKVLVSWTTFLAVSLFGPAIPGPFTDPPKMMGATQVLWSGSMDGEMMPHPTIVTFFMAGRSRNSYRECEWGTWLMAAKPGTSPAYAFWCLPCAQAILTNFPVLT